METPLFLNLHSKVHSDNCISSLKSSLLMYYFDQTDFRDMMLDQEF